ncbi:MAG: GNAT family N-acetyltransferase [Alphaproteobacteria bacterium]|nr:MAG: GNAT family N-acetyltransferase [Alphaproteobacteria bacterium]
MKNPPPVRKNYGAPPDGDVQLVKDYNMLFDVIAADTPELLEECFRLRYQVYCLETGFEDKSQFADQMEKDIYDDRSVSSLLIHRKTGMVAGTVRLILPPNEMLDDPLPAFQVSRALSGLSEQILPRSRTAEISRFSISKQFRKRHYDSHIPGIEKNFDIVNNHQRVIPHITLGLIKAILRMSVEHKISHLSVVIEPALQRLLRKLGMYFTSVGGTVEYHGRRRALYTEIATLFDKAYETHPEIWAVVTDHGRLQPYRGKIFHPPPKKDHYINL